MNSFTGYQLQDFVPFSAEVYFRLLERINESWWPLHLLSLALGAAALVLALFVRKYEQRGRLACLLIAPVWAWVAVVFFIQHYAQLNWAANYIAYAFFAQAIVLLWLGLTGAGFNKVAPAKMPAVIGIAIAVTGLVIQPLMALFGGGSGWQAQVFGIHADPTAIITLGLVLMLLRGWRLLLTAVIPMLWLLLSGLTLWVLEATEAWLLFAVLAAALLACLFLCRFLSADGRKSQPKYANLPALNSNGHAMANSAAIGIFDSGIGGLSVACAVRELLPNESLVYVADTGHAPYGEKTDDYIYQRMQLISQRLQQQGVKAIVVACNTATTAAITKLRAQCPLPVIGVEPGVKPAVLASKTGVVGILATPRTLQTPAFANLAQRFAGQARIELQPCPQLVQLIETMDFSGAPMQALLQSYIYPLLEKGADTLVLGCTHYNFVADSIAAIAGPAVAIIRTEAAVAKQLQLRLLQAQLLAAPLNKDPGNKEPGNSVSDIFYTSGNLELFRQQLQQLWPGAKEVLPL